MPVQGCALGAAPRRRHPSEALPPRRPGRAREVQARSSAAPRIAPPVCTAPGHGDSTRGRRTARHPWPRPWRVPGVQPRPRPSGVRARQSRGPPLLPVPSAPSCLRLAGSSGEGGGESSTAPRPALPAQPGQDRASPPSPPPGLRGGGAAPLGLGVRPPHVPWSRALRSAPCSCAPASGAALGDPPAVAGTGTTWGSRSCDVSGSKPRRPRGYGSRPKAPALTCVLVWPGCPARLPPPHSRGSWTGPLGGGSVSGAVGGCAQTPLVGSRPGTRRVETRGPVSPQGGSVPRRRPFGWFRGSEPRPSDSEPAPLLRASRKGREAAQTAP